MTRTGAPANGTELQMALLRGAQSLGWLVQMSRRSHMCRTESDAGYPDLFLSKPSIMGWIECKSKYEKLRPEQEVWARTLGFDPGRVMSVRHFKDGLTQFYVVARPVDYDQLVAMLSKESRWLAFQE